MTVHGLRVAIVWLGLYAWDPGSNPDKEEKRLIALALPLPITFEVLYLTPIIVPYIYVRKINDMLNSTAEQDHRPVRQWTRPSRAMLPRRSMDAMQNQYLSPSYTPENSHRVSERQTFLRPARDAGPKTKRWSSTEQRIGADYNFVVRERHPDRGTVATFATILQEVRTDQCKPGADVLSWTARMTH